ncbi:MAG: hypothetical protein PHE52_00825 [Candidatus Pacebacteria bacterium]|nr:hypothetical protein [Candidatus Paceibacterota bacterium]
MSVKTISRIETWEQLVARCKAVVTEEEAVGLLYSGMDVPYAGKYGGTSEERLTRVNFYLGGLKHVNEKIAATCGQLIIKRCLKELKCCLVGYDNGCLETTNKVLEFLQKPNEDLLKPPYPRFVSEYLLPLHEEWRHGRRPDYGKDKGHQLLQGSTRLIVRALCAWGLGYVLANDGLRPETIPMIKEFLDERGYETGKVFFKISGYGEPPADLSGTSGAEEVNFTAACAFLKLMFWVGGGFRAEFIRTIPPKHLAQ